ncbi:MAG: hypothetical protein RLZZ524_3249, partial [Pseudomonadota bacterium]
MLLVGVTVPAATVAAQPMPAPGKASARVAPNAALPGPRFPLYAEPSDLARACEAGLADAAAALKRLEKQ